MTMLSHAKASLRNELLEWLDRLERDLATLRLEYAEAPDADREWLSAEIAEVTGMIDEASSELDSIDECGFWRDR